MSIEGALIAQTQSFMVAARAKALIREEIPKGYQPEILPMPVSLEPDFQPLWGSKDDLTVRHGHSWTVEAPPPPEELVRLRVWISPEQKFDWNRSELFIKQLQTMSFRSGFEVAGNNKGITIAFLTHRSEVPIITAAFQGEFEFCKLTAVDEGLLSILSAKQRADVLFRDYFPLPPYSHLLTQPPGLHFSPLTSLIRIMSDIEAPAVGFYQALSQAMRPEKHWHRNVQVLLDFEAIIRDPEILSQTSCAYNRPYVGYGCDSEPMRPFCEPSCPVKQWRKSNATISSGKGGTWRKRNPIGSVPSQI